MGKLYVVGIGPGDHENMTVRADRILQGCDVICGYGVYVDLVKDQYPGKEYFTTPMTKEAERCRIAVREALAGKEVALVCSGDSGIYGMAGLVYEVAAKAEGPKPEIEVVPGITAAVSGAAVLGAPLTHDFAVISLSDRLTPWEKIEKRLLLSAEADLTIVLYNPASRGRPDHLRKACGILLSVLPGNRICGICRNIGREGESTEIMSLEALREAQADMFCTVFIGNSEAYEEGGKIITPRGYRDV